MTTPTIEMRIVHGWRVNDTYLDLDFGRFHSFVGNKFLENTAHISIVFDGLSMTQVVLVDSQG